MNDKGQATAKDQLRVRSISALAFSKKVLPILQRSATGPQSPSNQNEPGFPPFPAWWSTKVWASSLPCKPIPTPPRTRHEQRPLGRPISLKPGAQITPPSKKQPTKRLLDWGWTIQCGIKERIKRTSVWERGKICLNSKGYQFLFRSGDCPGGGGLGLFRAAEGTIGKERFIDGCVLYSSKTNEFSRLSPYWVGFSGQESGLNQYAELGVSQLSWGSLL